MIDCANFFIFFLACVTVGASFSLYLIGILNKGISGLENEEDLSVGRMSQARRLKLLLAFVGLACCVLVILWAALTDTFRPRNMPNERSLDPCVEQKY